MESRSEHVPPEQQAWNATYYSPQTPGRSSQAETALGVGTSASALVCAQVRAQLNALVENDGAVKSEAATALHVHMAVCAECAREFREVSRVVNMLEAMPLAELPRDYSPLVMRRIQSVGLCDRVRDKLQPLMDNDPGIRPEMSAALYGHLAVCGQCAEEFSRMRAMVNLLETLPPAELPIDYSAQIMRRIQQMEIAPATEAHNIVGPTFAASSIVSEGVATHEAYVSAVNLKTVSATSSASTLTSVRTVDTRQTMLQRLIASVAMTGMFIFLLASDWGRQMLSVNLEAARIWLSQISDHLEQAPVFGAIVTNLVSALGSVGDALSHAFSTLGGIAAQTLAVEVSLGLAACFWLSARRTATISGL